MGIISQLFERRSQIIPSENRWLIDFLGGQPTSAGIHVTEEKSLTLPAVWSAVTRISSTVSSLPLHVYQRDSEGKQKAPNHPLYPLLHDSPNPLMTAMQFRRTLTAHVLLWGNGYAWIQRNPRGQVEALWPLPPDSTTPQLTEVDGQPRIIYHTVLFGQTKTLMDYEVLHIAGLGYDGIRGYSVIGMEREAVSLGLSMQTLAGRLMGNNAIPPTVLVHPGSLSPEAQRNLVKAWREDYGGPNQGKIGVLSEGIEIKQLSMPLKDAEFLAQRNYTVADIARIFNIPLSMLEGSDKAATYASSEQFNLWYIQHTVRPWLITWEQAISLRLFTDQERKTYFAEHSIEGLLRGDSQARAEFYSKMFSIGAFSINDIRELENMNDIPDGDKHFVPLNMTSLDQPQVNIDPIVSDARNRILRRAKADIMREAEKTTDWQAFSKWLDSFLVDHYAFTEKNLSPIYESIRNPSGAGIAARKHIDLLSSKIKSALSESDPLPVLTNIFSQLLIHPEEVF